MKVRGKIVVGAVFLMTISTSALANPINDYYKKYKNDPDMEARIIPPKMAAMLVDEDYPEAIDILKSLSALKYMNYYGVKEKVDQYAKAAIQAKGDYALLLEENTAYKNVSVFGVKKDGIVRKIMAVVATETEFLLLIGKGKLTDKQIKELPALSKNI